MSRRVLFLAPYLEPSGYGRASRLYLDALLAAGCDVAASPVVISGVAVEATATIKAAEAAVWPPASAAVVFQIAPGPALARHSPAPHVALSFLETDPVPPTWAAPLAMMDAAVVPTTAHARWLAASAGFRGTGATVTVAPVPDEPARYARDYPRPAGLPAGGPFRFYSIGEWNRRKNWAGLLRAYFAAFLPNDPVELVIKTTAAEAAVVSEVAKVAKAAGLSRHPAVRVLTHRLSDDELCGLHLACDCFVQASFNEGWGLPAYDAVRFGRTPIVPAAGGFLEFVTDDVGFLVDAAAEPCADGGRIHPELFTGRHWWAGPEQTAMVRAMRLAAFSPDACGRRRLAAANSARWARFAPAAVGRTLCEVFDVAATRLGQPG